MFIRYLVLRDLHINLFIHNNKLCTNKLQMLKIKGRGGCKGSSIPANIREYLGQKKTITSMRFEWHCSLFGADQISF